MTFPVDENDARLLLSLCPGLGPVRFGRLLSAFGSAQAAWTVDPGAWAAVEGLGPAQRPLGSDASDALARAGKEKERIAATGGRWLTAADSEYPAAFRLLHDPPIGVTVWGRWAPADEGGVAIVGSRQPTAYGLAAAARLATELAEAGVTVVSGLARGIDGEAHRAALKAGGRTVGVLGSGWDRFYPREHRPLAEKMIQRGAVVSEHPSDEGPAPENFPRRNRLIAALSLGVIVVEAKERSGALITAALAADYGRDVFAVPGSIFSPLSRGPLGLMQKGAKPVSTAAEVLEELAVLREAMSRPAESAEVPVEKKPGEALSPAARRLWDALDHSPAGLDALASRAGLGPAEIGPACLALELSGLARELPGKQFVRTERVAP